MGPRRYHHAVDGTVIGYGDDVAQVRIIDRSTACAVIRANHYSGTIVNNAYVHLGLYYHGRLSGVAQFGYALNPSSGASIVAGTANREYLGLNRMWVDDSMPRNTESMALSFALRLIRIRWPRVRWVQSFADERCGRFGVVYQACSFLYLGCHRTRFYLLDGIWYHKMMLDAHKKMGNRGAHLRANLHRAEAFVFRQFRYIRLFDPRDRSRILRPVLPYPKPLGDVSHA